MHQHILASVGWIETASECGELNLITRGKKSCPVESVLDNRLNRVASARLALDAGGSRISGRPLRQEHISRGYRLSRSGGFEALRVGFEAWGDATYPDA